MPRTIHEYDPNMPMPYPFTYHYEKGAGDRHLSPHWPGGNSGVTISAGWDCSALTPETAAQEMRNAHFTEEQIERMLPCVGLHGREAQSFVANNASSFHITEEQSDRLFLQAVQRKEMELDHLLQNHNHIQLDDLNDAQKEMLFDFHFQGAMRGRQEFREAVIEQNYLRIDQLYERGYPDRDRQFQENFIRPMLENNFGDGLEHQQPDQTVTPPSQSPVTQPEPNPGLDSQNNLNAAATENLNSPVSGPSEIDQIQTQPAFLPHPEPDQAYGFHGIQASLDVSPGGSQLAATQPAADVSNLQSPGGQPDPNLSADLLNTPTGSLWGSSAPGPSQPQYPPDPDYTHNQAQSPQPEPAGLSVIDEGSLASVSEPELKPELGPLEVIPTVLHPGLPQLGSQNQPEQVQGVQPSYDNQAGSWELSTPNPPQPETGSGPWYSHQSPAIQLETQPEHHPLQIIIHPDPNPVPPANSLRGEEHSSLDQPNPASAFRVEYNLDTSHQGPHAIDIVESPIPTPHTLHPKVEELGHDRFTLPVLSYQVHTPEPSISHVPSIPLPSQEHSLPEPHQASQGPAAAHYEHTVVHDHHDTSQANSSSSHQASNSHQTNHTHDHHVSMDM